MDDREALSSVGAEARGVTDPRFDRAINLTSLCKSWRRSLTAARSVGKAWTKRNCESEQGHKAWTWQDVDPTS